MPSSDTSAPAPGSGDHQQQQQAAAAGGAGADASTAVDFKGADENNTEELEESSRSVLAQVLSQIRIGTDLTKILVPVNFLEPRSLLEKITDFMTHANLLMHAVDQKDPVQRMISLVKWYLSGWHVKPKGVKKPYNPALGELYRCHWDIMDEGHGRTAYIAEQVSHHPPISAIYAENRQKKLRVEGWYYPRSKLAGMNSVSSVAEGIVKVWMPASDGTTGDANGEEEYTATWPNVYARGIILGKLLMEYGGKTHITCEQTGLTAEIEFKTKPFFGGDYNLVSARIKRIKGSGQTLYHIHGKWNESYFIQNEGHHHHHAHHGHGSHGHQGAAAAAPAASASASGEKKQSLMQRAGSLFSRGSSSSSSPPPASADGAAPAGSTAPSSTGGKHGEELLFDTRTGKKFSKTVLPQDKLLPIESNMLWRHLGEAIRRKDIEAAAAEKAKVENRQREKQAEREQQGVQYKPRFFTKDAHENLWHFNGHDSPEFKLLHCRINPETGEFELDDYARQVLGDVDVKELDRQARERSEKALIGLQGMADDEALARHAAMNGTATATGAAASGAAAADHLDLQ